MFRPNVILKRFHLLTRNFSSQAQKPTFNYKDALNLESLLTQEEISLQAQAHTFAQETLAPQVISDTRNRHLSRDFYKQIGNHKFIAPT